MAEAFGIAAGVAGFVSLFVQINSGIETLRDIRKQKDGAPKELQSLTQELQFLADIMQRVIQSTPSHDASALQHCQTSCDEVVVLLSSLEKKFFATSKEHGPKKFIKILAFRQWKEAVDNLHRCIQAAKINLTLICVLRSNTQVEELALVNRIHLSHARPAEPKDDGLILDNVPTSSESSVPLTSTVSQNSDVKGTSTSRFLNPSQHRNCSIRQCSCSCHRTTKVSGRFWALQYTPLGAFREPCDNKSCTGTCYGISLRAAFSRYGIRWATILAFHLLNEEGKVFFRPVLGFQRVVPYTSPGFELLWKVNWESFSAEDAQAQLSILARNDSSFTRHVNPAGIGYLERNSIMGSCASILDPHPRDKVLDVLLASGLEPTEVGATFAKYADEVAFGPSDDLHVGFFRKLCSYDQEFAGMSNLHEAAVSGSIESAKRMMDCSTNDVENPLGQTPMHLAVQNPLLLKALIDHGYDINALDDNGFPPLAYACKFNQKDSVLALLEAGADHVVPFDGDLTALNCFDFALYADFWDLLTFAIEALGKLESEQVVQNLCLEGIKRLLYREPSNTTIGQFPERRALLSRLLATLDDQFLGRHAYPDLISHLRRPEDVQLLVKHSFGVATHQDHLGRNALSLVQRLYYASSPELLEGLIEYGVDVNHCRHTRIKDMLPPSPEQRVTKKALVYFESKQVTNYITMNVIHDEHKGVTVAKHVLVSFIRRVKHSQMDMTHVCCCRNPNLKTDHRGRPLFDWPLNDEDTDEILEEESDFIEILDREMDQLAHHGYRRLMQQWFLQVGELLEAYLANTSQIAKVFIPRRYKIVPDYEQDRYVSSLDEAFFHDPVLEVSKHIAYYIKRLDELYFQKYYYGYYTSQLDKYEKQQQYARRCGWLHELLRALDLSPEIVVKALREVGHKYTQQGETFDIEGAVDRFMNGANHGELWVLGDDS
ncbi:hypothetical protein EDB81DRAFT_905786, partial [Dactylonectria macrodidyma]